MTGQDDAAIIREYHEAREALVNAEAEETVKLAEVSDVSLRTAKVRLALPRDLLKRYEDAVIAMDQLKGAREVRWIEAHEWLKSPERTKV